MWWMHIAIWICWHNCGTLLQARRCIEQAPEARMNLLAIVSNFCFPREWCHAPRVFVELGVRVALTFGVHPRVVVGWEYWSSLQQRVYNQKCMAVGECSLDYIRQGHQQQRRVFRGQIRLTKSTGKPLVLHLPGKKGGDDEAYMETLGLLLEEGLSRRNPIYLHCYVVSWWVYSAWISCLSNVILGFSAKTTQISDFEKLVAILSSGSAWRVTRLISVHFLAGSMHHFCYITRQDWSAEPGMCLWLWCWQVLQ